MNAEYNMQLWKYFIFRKDLIPVLSGEVYSFYIAFTYFGVHQTVSSGI
jgi:hypothetical protein